MWPPARSGRTGRPAPDLPLGGKVARPEAVTDEGVALSLPFCGPTRRLGTFLTGPHPLRHNAENRETPAVKVLKSAENVGFQWVLKKNLKILRFFDQIAVEILFGLG